MLRAGFFNVVGESLNGTLATNSLSCDPCPKDCCPSNTTCVQTYTDGVGYDYSCSSSNEDYTALAYFFMGVAGVGVVCLAVLCTSMLTSKCKSVIDKSEAEEPLIQNQI